MASVPQVAEAIHSIVTEIPAAVARDTGFCQRRRKVSAAAFVQTTVFGWWQHPEATLTQLCQTAALCGVAITPQGLDQRFTLAGAALLRERLETAIGQVIAADPSAAPLLARFPAIQVLDSTTITLPDALATIWPGCGGRVATGSQAALKVTVRLDIVSGQLEGPELNAGRTQDRATALQHAAVPAGAVRLADLGFWSLPVLTTVMADDAYFLSRYHRQTHVAIDGVWSDLPTGLGQQTAAVIDRPVVLGKTAQAPVRLIALRVPAAVAAQRREQQIAHAQREGEQPPPPELANWTLLVTNIPPERLTPQEAQVLARVRWQIELLFKLWKSHAKLAASRSAKPARILCELYAKLLAVLFQHWVLLTACWAIADRSLVRAMSVVRAAALLIVVNLATPRRLATALRRILPAMTTASRIDKRRRRPSTFQLLADPSLSWP